MCLGCSQPTDLQQFIPSSPIKSLLIYRQKQYIDMGYHKSSCTKWYAHPNHVSTCMILNPIYMVHGNNRFLTPWGFTVHHLAMENYLRFFWRNDTKIWTNSERKNKKSLRNHHEKTRKINIQHIQHIQHIQPPFTMANSHSCLVLSTMNSHEKPKKSSTMVTFNAGTSTMKIAKSADLLDLKPLVPSNQH